MPEGFEKDDADGRGEIQTADVRVEDRDFQATIPVCVEQVFRQSTRLAAKDETIAELKTPVSVEPVCFSGEVKEASFGQ